MRHFLLVPVSQSFDWRLTMTSTLVRVYDSFATAGDARAALLASGFTPTDIAFSVRDDEAGPVAGNFIMNSKDAAGSRGLSSGSNDAGPETGGEINRRIDQNPPAAAVQRGTYLLTVETSSDDQARLALDILDRFRAIDAGEPL
jgi:hypothetical protein